MGIEERKKREKEQLKQRILDTALKQFVDNGFEKTSMRSISKEIEYSPTTIYLYFKNKDELFLEVRQQCFLKFFQTLKQVVQIEHPMERLKMLGRQYIKFALENVEFYKLMFILQAPMSAVKKRDERWTMGEKSHQILLDCVLDCQSMGYFPQEDSTLLTLTIWSYVHGIVTMKNCNRLDMYEDHDPTQLVRESLEVFNRMLERP